MERRCIHRENLNVVNGRVQPCRNGFNTPRLIEPLVQFIEETPRAEIVDRTLEKLRAGVPIKTMLTASALAVTRSSDLPPGHHGGPLHPVAGLYAVSKLVDRLEGEDKFLPVLQHVALSNKHIHDPATSPFQLLEFAPLDAEGGAVTAEEDLAADGGGDVARGGRRGDQGGLPEVRATAARATRPTITSCGFGRTFRRSRRSTC